MVGAVTVTSTWSRSLSSTDKKQLLRANGHLLRELRACSEEQ